MMATSALGARRFKIAEVVIPAAPPLTTRTW
jgi:hypothetical protein